MKASQGQAIRSGARVGRPGGGAVAAGVVVGALAAAAGPVTADEAGPRYRVADYFPLRADVRYTYDKRTRYRLGRTSEDVLERTPEWIEDERGRVLRLTDSEGEYQDLLLAEGAPSMGGQSMRSQGFVQRYDPPVTMWPAEARVGEAFRFESEVAHQTRGGTTTGSIVREVTLEGVEDVETAAGTFERCLRFRVVSENRPRKDGSFVARSEDTVWLAPGVGEVKSVSAVTLEARGFPFMQATITLELRVLAELV